MVKALSMYRLYRRLSPGKCMQILGRKPVYLPARTPLKLPVARFNYKQRQAIINWYWGHESEADYRTPLNTMQAVCAQLNVSQLNCF